MPVQISPDVMQSMAPAAIAEKSPSFSPPATLPKRSLWKIEEDLTVLEDLLEECEGDITQCEATIDAWFAELTTEAASKLDGYAGYIQELLARAEDRKEESERLAHRAKVDANLAGYLKDRMLEFFIARGWPKLETKRYKLTVCNNGGKIPLKVLVPAHELPERFRQQRIEYVARTDEITKALESGEELPFAALGERGKHIRIK